MGEETKTAIKMILGLIVLGAIIGAGIASAYWNMQHSSKLKQESEVMARFAVINLDRANTYLMKGDNRTAWMFLDNAVWFTDRIYELDKDYKIIMKDGEYIKKTRKDELLYDILWVMLGLEVDFNTSEIPVFTEKINETIMTLMYYSDIIKYYREVPEFEELYDKYLGNMPVTEFGEVER